MESLIEFLQEKAKAEMEIHKIICELEKKYMLKGSEINILKNELGCFEIKVTL